MNKLSVSYCDKVFINPFVLPSGIITEIFAHKRAIDAGAGGVTLKSVTKEPRSGNALPRMWKYDHGMLNSVGLRNPGITQAVIEIEKFLLDHKHSPSQVIVSLFATKVVEFVELVQQVVPLKPPFIELNLSCPNTVDEMGNALGMSREAAGKVVSAVKKVSESIPIIAKLSPNVVEIGEIAKACEDAGADGICAINTVGPGMIIDIKKRKPILGNKEGGVSGPGIFPVAVRCVYDIFEAVKIPIIGMGGVSKWQDVIEIMMAGATLVGVGSATYMQGMGVYEKLKEAIGTYIEEENIINLKEIIGSAHS